ncbi:glycosyltransferase [Hymenobacter gummosus]|uniref:Glycosyltransferase n=1 Tax=Hymenobacter gummosus TaxID=1776032 RepID=A0A3S0H4G0_9BACT|nr:glycosyltransferase family 2 protein [Hymenobacter gummosus]RTQ49140.1 glycosyltransferase [Hymenobacter gummosus]
MLVSVCVITRNEERLLGQCLASVAGLADELLVVDSGSTDATVAVARQHGARVHHIEWRHDYAWARNVAIEQARGAWILFLDADEYWQGPADLRRRLARTPAAVGGFLLERADVYLDLDSGKRMLRPVGLVRLFRRDARFRFRYAVHEQLNSSLTEAGARIEVLPDARIVHQIYAHDAAFLQAKQRRYLQLLDAELARQPTDEWLRYQRAKTVWFLQDKPQALHLFEALTAPITRSVIIRCSALCNAAILLLEQGQPAAAEARLQESLALNPQQSLAHLILGDLHYAARRYGLAARAYLRTSTSLRRLAFDQIIPGDLYLYPSEQRYKLGCCLLAAGRPRLAEAFFRWARRHEADHVGSLYGLALVRLLRRDVPAARRYAQELQRLNPEWQQLPALLRRTGA